MNQYTLSLAEAAATLENVGGKGMSLAKLVRAGLPVPDGFHVNTAAYRDFVWANHLQKRILAILQESDLTNPAGLEQASAHIRVLFQDSAIPEELVEQIRAAYAGLGGEMAVAVRSSATAEDLPDASFAGQQDTYLNIRGAEAVQQAVKRCWASLWTARAIGYRARQGIDPDSVALAVVVQELVVADAAGVMFTANPVNGKRAEAVINATWGLGEALVSGAVTPDTLTVEKRSGRVLSRLTATKQLMTVRTESGTEERAVAAELREQPVLSDTQAVELCALGEKIEAHYEMPMDVEWTLAGGKFAIVQARPITALPDEPLDWTPPKPKGVYMRGSVVDLLPNPVSPLFDTLGLPTLVAQMISVSEPLIGSKAVLADDYYTSINRYAYMHAYFSARSWLWIISMLPAYPRLVRSVVPFWRDVTLPKYRAQVEAYKSMDFSAQPSLELWNHTQTLVENAMAYVSTLLFATMGNAAGSEAVLRWVYNRWVRKEGMPPVETLLMGWDNVAVQGEKSLFDLAEWMKERAILSEAFLATETGAVVQAMQAQLPLPGVPEGDWAALRERFEQHLQRFGHIVFQLDFASDLPADHPEPMIESVKMYLRGEGMNPYERQHKSEEARKLLSTLTLSQAKGLKGWAFRKSLNWAQSLAEIREDALADIGLGYPVVKAMLTVLGGRMAQAGTIEQAADIFWLQKGEIQGWLAGLSGGNLKGEVVKRKAFDQQARKSSPPPMIPMKKKYMGMDTSALLAETDANQSAHALKGVAAGGGKVSGPACVLHGPGDFGKMKPGDVLVAGTTTPAWTPLFAMASAVVTDIGGPLSHGSIVAREYGIPAVMGTGVATRRIRDGQQITVDGDGGMVTLNDEGAAPKVDWTVQDKKTVFARGSLAEHTPGPVSPLFATLGLRVANEATLNLWKGYLGENAGELFPGGFYQTFNHYVYGGFHMDNRTMGRMMLLSIKQIGTMFKDSVGRWQRARQALHAVVDEWQRRSLVEMPTSQLIEGIRSVLGETINYYTVLQSAPLPSASMSEIMLDRVYRTFIKRKHDPEARTFLLGFDTSPLQAEKSLYDLAMWVRERPDMAMYVAASTAKALAHDLKHGQAPSAVAEDVWTEWKTRFSSHQAAFGRTAYGMDFMEPTPGETPELPLETIQQMTAGAAGNPYERQRHAVERREKLTQETLRRSIWPVKGWFKKALAWAQESASPREDGIADLGLGYPLLRKLFAELGGRFAASGAIAQAKDIYWLEEQEVLDLAARQERGEVMPDLTNLVAEREKNFRVAFKLSPPVMLPEKSRWSKMMIRDDKMGKDGRVVLSGTGTSSGTVTARACVVLSPEDFGKLKPGDVLVAVTTTPAWTPLFTLASAVVTDIGGPLSHSSIVAREYGIPAVMAVRSASRRIGDGQTITVDGNAGTVTI